jgi:hypothetical protein
MKRLILSLVMVSVTTAGWASAQEGPASASLAAGAEGETTPSDEVPAAEVQAAPAPVAAPVVAPIPLTSLPHTQKYREDQPPPPGYVLEERARRGLVIAGVAVVGAFYFTGIITTGVLQDFPNKTGFLAVPVVGPWITLLARDSSCVSGDLSLDCESEDVAKRLLIADGLIQALGTACLVTGFTWTKSVWVREDLANVRLVPGIQVAKLPGVPQPQGLSLVGQF